MTEKAKIAAKLRRKETEIASLEEKLRAARIYVGALRDVMKMLDGEEDGESSDADAVLKPGSTVAQAREIILQRGAPVHIGELLAAMGRESSRDARASVTSSLSAYVRRGEIFTRPAPNTFGLIELDHHKPEDPAISSEPPPGFGTQ